MQRGSNLVLLSGGLDSAVNLLLAKERGGVALAVTVDYGQRAAARELEKARALCRTEGVRHRVVRCRWVGEYSEDALTTPQRPLPRPRGDEINHVRQQGRFPGSVWVPNRNGLLVNVGACIAEALGIPWVVMGLNAEEGEVFPDNSAGFVREVNRALSYSTLTRVRLRSFTIKCDKREILSMALKLGLPLDRLWSCYNGEEFMCGECESCARLLAAAADIGEIESLRGLFVSRVRRRG